MSNTPTLIWSTILIYDPYGTKKLSQTVKQLSYSLYISFSSPGSFCQGTLLNIEQTSALISFATANNNNNNISDDKKNKSKNNNNND